MQLVECVANFSEGRNDETIRLIAAGISSVACVSILDIDASKSANRTVITFAGEPQAVFDAAFNAVRAAAQLIDMRTHKGEHPRIGATDVCPFVPLQDVSMEECVKLARRLGEKVGEELRIPVYLYAHAASSPERTNLPFIRRGQYEKLVHRMNLENFLPDFGPAQVNPRSGALVAGARDLLIAFNVNLATTSAKIAKEIAGRTRDRNQDAGMEPESAAQRSANCLTQRDSGTRLQKCRAIGWYIAEYGCAQVSLNLLDYRITSMHAAFEMVKRCAREARVEVTGSELIGLAPKAALTAAGRFYEKSDAGYDDGHYISLAVQAMGLDACKPFDPEKKILEYSLAGHFPGVKISL